MSTLYSAKMSAYEEEGKTLAEYRSYSGLAVVGFLLSLLSPLAFSNVMAAVIPVIAAAVNVVGLAHIARSRPAPKGKSLVLAGLFISLFCVSGGVVFNLTSVWVMKQQAKYVGDQWIEAVQRGDKFTIHQLSLRPDERETDLAQIATTYATDPAKQEALEWYIKGEPVHTLLKLGKGIELNYKQVVSSILKDRYERLTLLYLFRFEENGEEYTGYLNVVVHRRQEHRHAEGGWYLHSLDMVYPGNPDGPGTSTPLQDLGPPTQITR